MHLFALHGMGSRYTLRLYMGCFACKSCGIISVIVGALIATTSIVVMKMNKYHVANVKPFV